MIPITWQLRTDASRPRLLVWLKSVVIGKDGLGAGLSVSGEQSSSVMAAGRPKLADRNLSRT